MSDELSERAAAWEERINARIKSMDVFTARLCRCGHLDYDHNLGRCGHEGGMCTCQAFVSSSSTGGT